MSDHSDTESESDSISVSAWDPNDFARASAQLSLPPSACSTGSDKDIDHGHNLPIEVKNAVMTLQCMNLHAVRHDSSLHSTIQRASSAILIFLEDITSSALFSEEDSNEIAAAFSCLLQPKFISLLFDYRQVFHDFAARDLVPGTIVSVVVCWVDVVLAKLGEAAVTVAGGISDCEELSENMLCSLKKQHEEDALRAAAQLPGQWGSVPALIASDRASPAAIRLAIRLTFVVYVVAPQLGAEDPWENEFGPYDLLRIIQAFVNQVFLTSHAEGHNSVINQDGVSDQTKIMFAMVVALFSAADVNKQQSQPADALSPFLPRTLALLLRLMDFIMQRDGLRPKSEVISPCETLDAGQNILVHWGETVAWCWTVWDDPRIIDSESIIYLTVTWLYHLDRPHSESRATDCITELWELLLTPRLLKDVSAASGAILQIFHHAISDLCSSSPSANTNHATLSVLMKVCWGAVRLIDCAGGIHPELCSSLLNLLVLLGDTKDELTIKDLVTEALALSPHEVLGAALESVKADARFHFGIKLDAALTQLTRRLTNNSDGNESETICLGVNMTLNLLTIFWNTSVRGYLHRQTTSSFLGSVIDSILSGRTQITGFQGLLPCLLTTLGTMEGLRADPAFEDVNKLWEDWPLWQLAIDSGRSNISMASALACYVSSTVTRHPFDALSCVETWDFLRDVLLLILTHDFLGDDEPLALLAAPGISRSLMNLLEHSDPRAVQFILTSPWNINLCVGLRELLNEDTSKCSPYRSILKDRLHGAADTILQHMTRALGVAGKDNESTHSKETPKFSSRLIFYRVGSISHLISVCDPVL